MSHHTACDKVQNALNAGLPPNPADVVACRIERFIDAMLKARIFRWIPPIPFPDLEQTHLDELTTTPSIRDLLINELIIDALKNPAFGRGLFGDLQLSDVYTDALRGFTDELEVMTKSLRAELEGLERK